MSCIFHSRLLPATSFSHTMLPLWMKCEYREIFFWEAEGVVFRWCNVVKISFRCHIHFIDLCVNKLKGIFRNRFVSVVCLMEYFIALIYFFSASSHFLSYNHIYFFAIRINICRLSVG